VTTQEMLTAAEVAYHSLMTGTMAKVFVDQNGERVEYNTASAPRLAQYINDLRRQLGTVTAGPMQFFF